MKIINNCVLLLKAEKTDQSEDKFKTTLENEGFEVKLLKTLDFNYVNLEQLFHELNNPDLYKGIIFTTPRAVTAVGKALSDCCLDTRWTNKNNYAVGETTSECALKEINLKTNGRSSGNANELAKIIINENPNCDQPFLFPCGSLKTESLINDLQAEHIQTRTVTVYETIGSKTLSGDFAEVTQNFTNIPEYFVYFSPSGVTFTKPYLERLKEFTSTIKFIAIGPTTERSLRNEAYKVASVASKPNPTELIKALLQCKQ